MTDFSATVQESARRLHYTGFSHKIDSPAHLQPTVLCQLVNMHGEHSAQNLINEAQNACTRIADVLPTKEYLGIRGFGGLRSRMLGKLAEMSAEEVEDMHWDLVSALRFLDFTEDTIQDALDNRWAPRPWSISVNSCRRSRSSVRPWRALASKNKKIQDLWHFIDHEVYIAERVSTRLEDTTYKWVLLRVTKVSDFGNTREVLFEVLFNRWKSGPGMSHTGLEANKQAWLDWLYHKTDEMPKL